MIGYKVKSTALKVKASPKAKAAPKAKAGGKREEVLEIASNCFLSNGFDGTSINVMARDAGISKESIYRYFGSKEDLFKAVIERELEVYQKGMQDTAADYHEQTLDESLFHVAETTLKLLTNERTQALRRLVFHMAAGGSRVGRYYYQVGPRIAIQNLVTIFEYHLRRQASRGGMGPEKLSQYFMGMVLHPTTLERECGVVGELSTREVRRRSREIVADFLAAFFDPPLTETAGG